MVEIANTPIKIEVATGGEWKVIPQSMVDGGLQETVYITDASLMNTVMAIRNIIQKNPAKFARVGVKSDAEIKDELQAFIKAFSDNTDIVTLDEAWNKGYLTSAQVDAILARIEHNKQITLSKASALDVDSISILPEIGDILNENALEKLEDNIKYASKEPTEGVSLVQQLKETSDLNKIEEGVYQSRETRRTDRT